MDPNEALRIARAAAKVLHTCRVVDSERGLAAIADLRDHFDALDVWLVRGGFLPADWQKARGIK